MALTIKASDYSGAVPYGQECEAAVMPLLPVGTYLLLKHPKPKVARLLDASPYPFVEVEYNGSAGRLLLSKTLVVVPLADADALAMVPLGKKVQLFVVPAGSYYADRLDGLVTAHLKRRVRVSFAHKDGSPGERDLYVSQLAAV